MTSRCTTSIMAAAVCLLAPAWSVADEPEPNTRLDLRLSAERSAELSAYFDDDRRRGLLRVRADGLDWTSPVYAAWKVRVADLDGDDRDEVLLGVWSEVERHDEPQPHRAVWVLGWRDGRLETLWRGSALARPMRDFAVADLDEDGRAELLSLETNRGRTLIAAYQWTGFGFGGRAKRIVSTGAAFVDSRRGCLRYEERDVCFKLDEGNFHEEL